MILIALGISLLLHIWYVILPTVIWWDSAIYIGIGKHLFSGGVIGIWEAFRPILMPLILGSAWKIGIDPLILGKIIMVVSSVALMWFVYKIGEKLSPNTGLYASILTGFTPVLILYSNNVLTDIPSTLFGVLAFYLVIKKKYIWAGVSVGLAFLLRFPQILSLVPLVITIWILTQDSYREKMKQSIYLGIGFALLALPFFIGNYIAYNDPLLPITMGSTVVAGSVHSGPHDYLYYLKGLLFQNPLLVLGFIPLILIAVRKRATPHLAMLISIISFIVIFGGYFSQTRHQEVRYGIAFLPYIALLAGYGLTFITSKINYKYATPVAALVLLGILGSIIGVGYSRSNIMVTPVQMEYLTYFKDKGLQTILTTSPQMIVYSDIIIGSAPSSWEEADKIYEDARTRVSYAAINTCELVCENPETCPFAQKSFLSKIKKETILFSKEVYSCNLYILQPKPSI